MEVRLRVLRGLALVLPAQPDRWIVRMYGAATAVGILGEAPVVSDADGVDNAWAPRLRLRPVGIAIRRTFPQAGLSH